MKKDDFSEQVHVREERKIRARKKGHGNVWFGLGTFGMVGWTVAIPMVIGIFVGVWLDVAWSGSYSWTLMLLGVGLFIGCLNAWYWINRQRKDISRDRDKID